MIKTAHSLIEDAILNRQLYTAVVIHGVRDNGDGCVRADDDNPEFYSAYIKGRDGTLECIIDAETPYLANLRRAAGKLAEENGWLYVDHTSGNYEVKFYALVCVAALNVKAGTPAEAIDKAKADLDFTGLLSGANHHFTGEFSKTEVMSKGADGAVSTVLSDGRMIKPLRAAVIIEGGLVQYAISDGPLEIAVLDADAQDADEDELIAIGDDEFIGHIEPACVNKIRLDGIFGAFAAENTLFQPA